MSDTTDELHPNADDALVFNLILYIDSYIGYISYSPYPTTSPPNPTGLLTLSPSINGTSAIAL